MGHRRRHRRPSFKVKAGCGCIRASRSAHHKQNSDNQNEGLEKRRGHTFTASSMMAAASPSPTSSAEASSKEAARPAMLTGTAAGSSTARLEGLSARQPSAKSAKDHHKDGQRDASESTDSGGRTVRLNEDERADKARTNSCICARDQSGTRSCNCFGPSPRKATVSRGRRSPPPPPPPASPAETSRAKMRCLPGSAASCRACATKAVVPAAPTFP
mmetsp:Transcript_73597/g.238199  ORF Transcript_73597/g.238199 Transcript_73597/m.238199 type:complete len:216 (+) Transcript_73597:510-1157(+)